MSAKPIAATVTFLTAVLLTLAVAPLASALEPGSAADSSRATKLAIKINSTDSKPKIKVGRSLKVLVSCSKDCRAKAKIRLKTPINRLNVGGSQLLTAGAVWTTGIRLTSFGLRYLKKNYRKSTLRVAIRAKDTATGQFAEKTRVFRFYR